MVDARNHGQSGRAVGTSEDLSADVAIVVTALKLAPVTAPGHSVGVVTVAGLAAQYPALVSRIILEDPIWIESPGVEDDSTADKRRSGFLKYLNSMAEMSDDETLVMGKKQHPLWHADEFPDWVQSNRQVDGQALARLKYGDWNDNVAKIQCPALLIYADGEGDGMLKQAVVDKILDGSKCFSATRISDTGHKLRREQFG